MLLALSQMFSCLTGSQVRLEAEFLISLVLSDQMKNLQVLVSGQDTLGLGAPKGADENTEPSQDVSQDK